MKKDLGYYKQNAEEDYITTPISVLRYIGEVERRNIYLNTINIILIFMLFLSYYGVYKSTQVKTTEDIKNRAKEINKECITNQELEYIIFGEIQE